MSRITKNSTIVFGEPEPVLTNIYNSISINNKDDIFEPHISREELAKLPNLNGQHGGVIYSRRNMMVADYVSGGLTYEQMLAAAFDFVIFGDIALLKMRNQFDQIIGFYPLPSLYLRVKKTKTEPPEIDGYLVLQGDKPIEYAKEEIIFIKQHDPQQQVYGLPDYVGGIHSALLNSESTLFRRRYYHNGAHLGYIFYATDPSLSIELEDEIKEKISQSKGVGNFRSMFINIPNGRENGVQIIPVGDSGAKDEFANIKNISAQDILTAHRFPAGLAGIIPQNAAGLGDPEKLEKTYKKTEISPIHKLFCDAINRDEEVLSMNNAEQLKLTFSSFEEGTEVR